MNIIKKYKSDIILIVSLIIIGVSFFLFIYSSSDDGKYVVIRIGGEVKNTFSLDNDLEYEIKTDDGDINLLKIEDGSARIETASCPDKLCVKNGKIKYVGQSVICLPNKVVIEIVSDIDDYREIDVKAG